MEYKLDLTTVTEHYVFSFQKTRYAKTINEIIDYVNEMKKIFKKSTKLIVVIYDENKKKIAMYDYDSGWLIF